jgi:cytosine/adenosine deaminase-related metal-dependent hydrolase
LVAILQIRANEKSVSITELIRNAVGPVRIRARWVLPITMPPIENGEVAFEDGLITYVGPAKSDAPTVDLGLAALLPGFVNVHAHLEYTLMRGLVEDVAFFPWIRTLTALKAYVTYEEWVASATLGAAEMIAAGITTIGDACDAGASLNALVASGLRGTVFREVFGIEREPSAAVTVDILKRRLTEMRSLLARSSAEDRIQLGISPHAPYTVRAELLQALAEFADKNNLMQTIHLAESVAEEALFRTGTGPFKEMFTRRGIAWKSPNTSPIDFVRQSGGLAADTLAVHCVHATDDDARVLANNNAAIAHCPRSNGKLGAGLAPLRLLKDRGLDIGLGTDSMVSANSVDFFEEMRAAVYCARAREQDVAALSAREILSIATLGGARALRLERKIGSLEVGKCADLCGVRLDGLHLAPATDRPIAALVYSARASDVALTIGSGKVLFDHGHFPLLDVARLRQSVLGARQKIKTEGATILAETN